MAPRIKPIKKKQKTTQSVYNDLQKLHIEKLIPDYIGLKARFNDDVELLKYVTNQLKIAILNVVGNFVTTDDLNEDINATEIKRVMTRILRQIEIYDSVDLNDMYDQSTPTQLRTINKYFKQLIFNLNKAPVANADSDKQKIIEDVRRMLESLQKHDQKYMSDASYMFKRNLDTDPNYKDTVFGQSMPRFIMNEIVASVVDDEKQFGTIDQRVEKLVNIFNEHAQSKLPSSIRRALNSIDPTVDFYDRMLRVLDTKPQKKRPASPQPQNLPKITKIENITIDDKRFNKLLARTKKNKILYLTKEGDDDDNDNDDNDDNDDKIVRKRAKINANQSEDQVVENADNVDMKDGTENAADNDERIDAEDSKINRLLRK